MTLPCDKEQRICDMESELAGVRKEVYHQHEKIGDLSDSVRDIVTEIQGFRTDVREALTSMSRLTGQASVVRWLLGGGGFAGAAVIFTAIAKHYGWL